MNLVRKIAFFELTAVRQKFNQNLTEIRARSLSTKIIKPDPRQRYRRTNYCIERFMSTNDTPPQMEVQSPIPKGLMGQPTCHTHPHLISDVEHLTRGILQSEYCARRNKLMNRLERDGSGLYKSHVVIIPAASKMYMSEKIPYVFRQNSDFFYLTGCMEPSAILVLIKQTNQNSYESILFLHNKDPYCEQWEGPRTGCEEGARLFLVDEARPLEYFSQFIHHLTSTAPAKIWYYKNDSVAPDINDLVNKVLRRDMNFNFGDPKEALHEMRLIKSPAEVELITDACCIGAQAMNMAMSYTKPGVTEHMIHAVLEFSSKQNGAEHLAYPPVVAGGSRATHIHYVNNNQVLRDGEMLLVDAGCQRWLYNSDISRTWPVSGKFNPHHRILYELVLTVQKRLIQILDEHRPSLDQLFDSMCRLLGRHLQQEGIIPKHVLAHELPERAYRLCPHHVSHYLGLDVHDSSLMKRNMPVCSNMVVTVEPGIYISPHNDSVPQEFRGLGIRIEDDILITPTGVKNLTSSCVKEVEDVEALVGTYRS